jgi:AcrR family transcriptional regulator
LAAAQDLFAEKGYEGVTMTAIAQRAGASFGALYDYFPDKVSIASVLFVAYTQEADDHWAKLLKGDGATGAGTLANLIVEGAIMFLQAHPAYLTLLEAPMAFARTKAARRPLRSAFGAVIHQIYPDMEVASISLASDVIVGLLKALFNLYKDASSMERERLRLYFKSLIQHYLECVLPH